MTIFPMVQLAYREKAGGEEMGFVKSVNFFNPANGSGQIIPHAGTSLIIQQEKVTRKNDPGLSFYLYCWEYQQAKIVAENTQVLEFPLAPTTYCSNQNDPTTPLKVTEGIQQFTTLLFAYYTYCVAQGIYFPVEQAAVILVDLILSLNREFWFTDEVFSTLLFFMEQNVYDSLTVNDFCLALHVSRASLNRLSRKHVNLPVMKLFRICKCRKAENVLLETSLTVQEIGRMFGFKDTSHFIKTFKKINGSTPLEFRRKARWLK